MKVKKEDFYYHGSSCEIKRGDLSKSREDIDFGSGFYLTKDSMMAKKWAANKTKSFLNKYKLDLTVSTFKIHIFGLDKEWLDYVKANRGYGENIKEILNKYFEFDIIIGPTADDKLFDTIQQYIDGYITSEQAIKYLNIAGYSEQIVLKTEKALDCCKFISSKEIKGFDKEDAKNKARQDRIEAHKKLDELKKKEVELMESNLNIIKK